MIVHYIPEKLKNISSGLSDYFMRKATNEDPTLARSAIGWKEFRDKAKNQNSLCFKISETIDDFEIFCSRWHRKLIRDPYYYIMHRFIWKTHIIKTDMVKGQYYDEDSRLIFAVMSIVKEYMENDNVGWVLKESPNREIPTHQIETVLTCKEALDWWNNYDNRVKQIDRIYEELPDREGDNIYDMLDDDSNREERMKIYDKIGKEEQKLKNEARDWIIKIAQVRDSMWS